MAQRVEVPFKQTVMPNDLIHYSVDLTVGGHPVEAMLDSGATGLRLLPTAAPSSAVRKTSAQSTYAYAIGVELRGAFARAKVGVGGLETDDDFYVQTVERIGCVDHRPNCPASKVGLDKFRLGGRAIPDQGYLAIVGVGLRGAGVGNPLAEIATGAWIIKLPKPDASAPGTLILNPTSDDRAGYALFQLERESSRTPVAWSRVVRMSCRDALR